MTARNLYVAHAHVKLSRQRTHKLPVGGSIDGRRVDADAQRAVMFPNDLAARGARHNPHSKGYRALAFKTFDQALLHLTGGQSREKAYGG
jgi:hypothetical protein